MTRAVRRALAAAGLVVLAAAAVVAAVRLWRTSVPAGLHAPAVDVDAAFGTAAVARARSFEAFLRVTGVLGEVVLVVTLTLYAWRGARFARESAAGPIGTGFLLGMLGLAIVWLAQLPFTVVELWWLRRHGVVRAGYVDALVSDVIGLGVSFLFVCLALLIAMWLARLVGGSWWVPAVAIFATLFALYAFASPKLAYGLRPAAADVRAQADRLAAVEGLRGRVPVRVESVHDATSEPNAYAMGIGPTRTVVLWDTLAHRFPPAEVRVTVAHELGHLVRRHVVKQIGWFAVLMLPTALLVALVARRRGGLGEPAAVPLALLAFVVAGLVTAPLQNAVSRRYEAEADWTALQATRDPRAMEGLMRGFTRRALSDPEPPGWWHVLFDTHPSGAERVAMARAWAARHAAP